MLPSDALAALSAAPFLRCVDPSEAEELIRAAKVRHYQPREQVWTEGDPIPGIIFNTSGLSRVFLEGEPEAQVTITTLWPGEVPPGSVLQRAEWASNAVAVSPVVQATIPSSAFYAACTRTPALARQVLQELLSSLYRRYAWEMDLRMVPLKRRLLMLFGRMADVVGTPTSQGILLDFPLTQQIAAHLTWVKRDHAGRILKELTEEGYLIDRPCFRWLVPDRQRPGSIHRLPVED